MTATMQMLYDSEAYVVVQETAPDGTGFQVVDKRANKSVMLWGSWALVFQAQIERWQAVVPDQEEVEGVLFSYAELAQNPLVIH